MRGPMHVARAAAAVVAAVGVIAVAAGVGSASASVARSCGDIAQTSRHLAILNVTTRVLHCRKARRAALKIFHCPRRHCGAVGYRFTCRNLGRDEAVEMRCVAGRVVVRFQTGV